MQACGTAARHFKDMATLQAAVGQALPTVGSVLVKGSRFMKMEQVVQALQALHEDGAAGAAAQGGAACC